MSVVLNGLSGGGALVSFTFFIIGCIGFGTHQKVIENVAWIHADNNNLDIYYGLQYIYVNNNDHRSSYRYGNSYECTEDYCDKCRDEGRVTFSLLIIATIFSAWAIWLSSTLVSSPSNSSNYFVNQVMNLSASLGAAVTSLIAISIFMGDCYRAVRDSTNDNVPALKDANEVEWGQGAAVATVGMLVMWLIVFFQIIALSMGASQNKPAAVPAQDPATNL